MENTDYADFSEFDGCYSRYLFLTFQKCNSSQLGASRTGNLKGYRMYQRIIAVSFLTLASFAFSGCCITPCGGGCLDGCGPGVCGPAGCGPVGCAPLDIGGAIHGKLADINCKSGCGEVYWGEWHHNPPADCDPCDNHGNWIGPTISCNPCDWLTSGLHHLWGYRYCPTGCDTGCSSCDTVQHPMPIGAPVPATMVPETQPRAVAPQPPVPVPAKPKQAIKQATQEKHVTHKKQTTHKQTVYRRPVYH